MPNLKIFLDPGHGGKDSGACGHGMKESDIVLEVAQILSQILKPVNIDVKLSRSTDTYVDINDRYKAANAWGADYFISIHANAGKGTGVETFVYQDLSERSRKGMVLAEAVTNIFAQTMGLKNRGVKRDDQSNAGSLGVLRYTHMPAILVELAFIDTSEPDAQLLKSNRHEMAVALADGIFSAIGLPKQLVHFEILGKQMDIPGVIVNGNTYAQVRPIVEEIGCCITWDENSKTVVIK